MLMDFNQVPDEIGCWKKEKILVAGGFGFVILWQNKETHETIALKQCRWGRDSMMTPKHRSRWKLEVDIMFRLDHPNVVKAFNVPPELDVPATELPLLAMEYCSGGDLRKLLNRPENCCGLKEKQVRLLLRHISSAVNYLHSMRIIHRDLKPENIVIQEVNGSMFFKLIDLGYAKELDQGSLCTSFVGTLQYLAPELFMSQKYSCTVDYWSLGLVTHEVITGLRPFLPDKSPAEWIPIIKEKKSSEIRAYLDDDKNIVFSDEIAPHHHICSTLKAGIELWLTIMLEYDPKKRGRCKDTSAFVFLDEVLDKKLFRVFSVHNCQTLSLSADEISSMDDFQKLLELKTGVPIIEQEILLPKGNIPSPDKDISQFISKIDDDDVCIYVFTKNENILPVASNTDIPPVVETMMRNPRTEVSYQEQRFAWAQAVYLSQQQHTLIGRCIQAFRTNLIHLLSKTSHSHKSASKMVAEMNKLVAIASFLETSLEQDISSYETQAENSGFASEQMLHGWKNTYKNLKKMDLLKQKVTSLEEKSASIDAETIELQRTNYARSKQTNPLEDMNNKILEAYNDLKRRSKDQRHIPHDNTDIVRLLCMCLQQSRSSLQDVMLLIRQTNKIKRNIDEVVPQISDILQEINSWDTQICSWQFQRQMNIWKVIDALTEKIRHLEQSSSSLQFSNSPDSSRRSSTFGHSIQNGHDSPFLHKNVAPPIIPIPVIKNKIEPLSSGSAYLNGNIESSRRLVPSIPSLGTTASLASFLDQTMEDTYRVRKENSDLVESFQEMMNTLKNDDQNQTPPGINKYSFKNDEAKNL